MTTIDLFNLCTRHWPASVDLSHAGKNASGGLWFHALAEIQRHVEERAEIETDHWASVACWSFYQAITAHAARLVGDGIRCVVIAEVPLLLFDQRVRQNLDAPDWEPERDAYQGIQ